jgi:hypothetical protein
VVSPLVFDVRPADSREFYSVVTTVGPLERYATPQRNYCFTCADYCQLALPEVTVQTGINQS